jgi:hypothetical protein
VQVREPPGVSAVLYMRIGWHLPLKRERRSQAQRTPRGGCTHRHVGQQLRRQVTHGWVWRHTHRGRPAPTCAMMETRDGGALLRVGHTCACRTRHAEPHACSRHSRFSSPARPRAPTTRAWRSPSRSTITRQRSHSLAARMMFSRSSVAFAGVGSCAAAAYVATSTSARAVPPTAAMEAAPSRNGVPLAPTLHPLAVRYCGSSARVTHGVDDIALVCDSSKDASWAQPSSI